MAFVLCKLGREQGIKLSFTHRKFNSFRTLKDLNRFGVDLLPDNLNRRLFLGVKCKPPDEEQIEFSLSELEKFGLNSPGLKINLPDITNLLPVLKGRNVLDHFSNIGKQQTQPYLSILSPLLNASVPPAPRVWRIEPGWIRYGFDGSIERVNFPLGKII